MPENLGIPTVDASADPTYFLRGHLALRGDTSPAAVRPVPTLGALQTNVSTQTLSATADDNSGAVNVGVSGTAVAAGAAAALVNFGIPFANVPIVQLTVQSGHQLYVVAASVTINGFTIQAGSIAFPISQTVIVGYVVIGK